MTPQERAEKIAKELGPLAFSATNSEMVKQYLAAQIADVERDTAGKFEVSVTSGLFNLQDLRDAFHAGFKTAREKAAGIVEQFNLPDDNEFYWYKQQEAAAKTIRAMSLDEKGPIVEAEDSWLTFEK